MDNMCKFKILSITYKTIILRKPIYLNKLLNEELMRYSSAIFKFIFSAENTSDENWEKIVRLGSPYMWNYLPKSLRRTRSRTELKRKLRIFLLTIKLIY